MTPSASASPIVLLAPTTAPAGAAASTENTAAPALDGGFQLLVDVAAQQQLAAQLAGSGSRTQAPPATADGEPAVAAGNVLPLPGLILPTGDEQPVVADGSGRKIEDGVDQDDTASTTPPSATTIPLPWVPINIQPQQQSTAGGGSHASAEADATIDTDLDATAKPTSSTVALPPAGTTAPATAAATDPAAAAAAGVGGIQLGVAGMSVPGANRQAAPDKTAQPAVGALADAAADGSAATPLGDATGGRKGGDVASFADALKPALGATAADTGQPAATPVGAVDAGRSHAPTRSYLDVNNATAAAATVSVPVGSNGWTDAVVDKVMWFSANQINSAEIKLNPPDLGPLHVRISTQQDQTSVVFSSPHAAVRDALDQALPRLRDMFGGQGLQLSDASVGGQAQRQQQDAQQQSARQGQASGWFGAEDSGDTPVAVTRVNGSRLSTSAVDAYA